MGFLSRFFGDIGGVRRLAQQDVVAQLLPADATYVTTGVVTCLPDVADFNSGGPGQGPWGRDLGMLPSQYESAPVLLIATPRDLIALNEHGTLRSYRLDEISALDAHRNGGFLVFTSSSDGLAVSQQTPVQVPPGYAAKTHPRMSNAFGGWEKVLDVPHFF